jgi:hypothetical protein
VGVRIASSPSDMGNMILSALNEKNA